MIAAHFRACEDDDDLAVLRRCMRPEEDMRQYRQRTPWKGEYRFFRSENVVCIEHFSGPRSNLQIANKNLEAGNNDLP
jgi:hypothetical protein